MKRVTLLLAKEKNSHVNLFRKIVTYTARQITRIFYGGSFQDVNIPCRLIKTDSLKVILSKLTDHLLVPNIIILGIASLRKMKILEVEVDFSDRKTDLPPI